jgi:hypothetical protein
MMFSVVHGSGPNVFFKPVPVCTWYRYALVRFHKVFIFYAGFIPVFGTQKTSVSDQHSLYAVPDPAFQANADPDPAFKIQVK